MIQEKGGPKMQDTETDDKSNKGQALMKADKKYRKPTIQNPEYEKTKAERKNWINKPWWRVTKKQNEPEGGTGKLNRLTDQA